MAANSTEINQIVDAMKSLAREGKSFKSLVDQALAHNSAQQIDWGQFASNYPELLGEDGDIIGAGVSPAEISNAIGSLAAYQTYWGGGHGGNFEKLTTPIV